MTKRETIRELEAKGFSFTVNVIMNGCGKPATKLKNLLKLVNTGHNVRHAQFETCAVIVDGEMQWFSALDDISWAVPR
jgi:hypothetical protein